MTKFTRREFLAATAGAALAPAAASSVGRAEEAPIVLRAESHTIEVNGKAATMLHIGRSDGVWGVYTEAGRRYRVNLENHFGEPTLVHWHGLMPPYQPTVCRMSPSRRSSPAASTLTTSRLPTLAPTGCTRTSASRSSG